MKALLIGIVGIALAGCQVPGRITDVKKHPSCPKCETVTRTALLKDVTYTEHHCPTCGRIYRPDWSDDQQPGGGVFGFSADAMLESEVAYCERCHLAMSDCRECMK